MYGSPRCKHQWWVEEGSLFQKKATLDKTLGRDGGRGGGGWRKKHGNSNVKSTKETSTRPTIQYSGGHWV